MKTVTYIGANVLIGAACGESEIARKALVYLDDPDREHASSESIKLEIMPKAIFHKKVHALEIYEAFFSKVKAYASSCDEYIEDAHEEASGFGLRGIDALHISIAKALKASGFVTGEKSTKPIFNAKDINVISTRE